MNDMFVRRRGQVDGPFPVDEIRAMIARGEIVPLHEFSYDGVEWVRAGKIWDEIVPKPSSMLEMAERRPMTVKPAVQPVDLRQNLSRKPKTESGVRSASATSSTAPLSTPPAAPPQAVPPPASLQPPVDDAPVSSTVGDATLDDLAAASDDEDDVERKVRPEPTVGMKGLRAGAVLVGIFTLMTMALAFICIVLDLQTLDAFQPITLERLGQLYSSGIFAWSDFARLVIAVCKLIQFVLFMIWIYFSAEYLYEKSHGRMQYRPAWCVGWFFVPVMNLWKPYKVLAELQRRSESYFRFDDPRIIRDPVVGLWWTCWVLEIVAFKILAWTMALLPRTRDVADNLTHRQVERLAEIPQLFADFLATEIATFCVTIVAGIATLVLLYRLERVRPKWETKSRRRRAV